MGDLLLNTFQECKVKINDTEMELKKLIAAGKGQIAKAKKLEKDLSKLHLISKLNKQVRK